MYTSNRQPSCGHIFAQTLIVNNTSCTVDGSRGSSGQRVSSRRQCIHPSGSTSSCRIDQQPSFVSTEIRCPVRKRSAKVSISETSGPKCYVDQKIFNQFTHFVSTCFCWPLPFF